MKIKWQRLSVALQDVDVQEKACALTHFGHALS